MKKLLIPILILPLMFFTGCSDEDDTATGSTESYTMSDLVGTWDTTQSSMTQSMSIDFAILGAASGLTGADLTAVALATCTDEYEGTLNGLVCTASMTEELCCEEGQSQTVTITSDGSFTEVDTDAYGSETITGTITIDGTDLTMTFTDEGETFTTSGTLSISGTTATFDIAMDMSAYNVSGMTLTASQIIIAEKAAE